MSAGRLFAVSLVAVMASVAAFALLAQPVFMGAEPMFDARSGGYDSDEARAYLAWLGAEGLHGDYRRAARIDLVFPLAVFGLLASAIWGLWARPVRAVAVLGLLVSLAYLGFDYSENWATWQLYTAGEGVTEAAVTRASMLTQLKWSALGAAVLLVLAGLALTFWKGGKR